MEKFIVLVAALVITALSSGCATQNPNYRFAQQVGGTVGGAVVGNYLDRAAGGRGFVGGVVGAVVGNALATGTQPASRGYACVNCGNTQQAQGQYYDQNQNPGVASAAYAGASQNAALQQCELERRAFYSNGGRGQYRCGSQNSGYQTSGHSGHGVFWTH